MRIEGVRLTSGSARGPLMVLKAPLSFYGGVDPDTGIIVQADHPDRGRCIQGALLVLERSTGSTVGSWTLLRMAQAGTAPAAILSRAADAVLVTGTVTAGIVHLDRILVPDFLDGQNASIDERRSAVDVPLPNGCNIDEPSLPSPAKAAPRRPEPVLADPTSGVVVKLGGSLITVKSSSVARADGGMLRFLARLLASELPFPAVLVHGAGSFGHAPVARGDLLRRELDPYTRLEWGRIAALQYQLDAIVAEELAHAGLPVWPLQASALGGFDEAGRLRIDASPLREALSRGFVPLLYGTVGFEAGRARPVIVSGDDLAPEAALQLGFSRIIHLTDAPGVCESDPRQHPDARVLPFLPAEGPSPDGTPDSAFDVTGAMGGKIRKLQKAAQAGIVSWIVDGRDEHAIHRALSGLPAGTVVGPAALAHFFDM